MRKASQTNVNDGAYWDEIYAKEDADKVRVDYMRITALKRWVRIRENELQRSVSILDAGCGPGEALQALQHSGRYLCGLDISSYVIERNQALFGGHSNYEWRCAPVHEIGNLWREPSFDIVWCGETLEHLDDPFGAIAAFGRVCQPQGFVVLSTPFKQRNVSDEHVWEFGPNDITEMAELIGELVHLDCCLLPGWLTMFAVIRVGGAT